MGFPLSQWTIGAQGDKPILVIVTRWYVTHVPGSKPGLPVRLLKVRLLGPLAKGLIHARVTITSGTYQYTREEDTIPNAETRNLIIQCSLSKVLKPEKPLKVHLVVEDQLTNEHKLPPITVLPAQSTD